MNNEPVAWMIKTLDGRSLMLYGEEQPPKFKEDVQYIPLYTHPVKCNKCNDTEWVCENHPDQEAHKCIHCGGAGKPCECTHPVKEQLTDEEINQILKQHDWYSKTWVDMVRSIESAILRKAQEK